MLKYRQKPNRVQEKEKQDSGQLSVANPKAGRSDAWYKTDRLSPSNKSLRIRAKSLNQVCGEKHGILFHLGCSSVNCADSWEFSLKSIELAPETEV